MTDDAGDDKGGGNNDEAEKRLKHFVAGLTDFLGIAGSGEIAITSEDKIYQGKDGSDNDDEINDVIKEADKAFFG